MKRIRSYCKKDMGEKCGECGSLHLVILNPFNLWMGTDVSYHCRDCNNIWKEGTDGVSHGACDPACPAAVAFNSQLSTLNP